MRIAGAWSHLLREVDHALQGCALQVYDRGSPCLLGRGSPVSSQRLLHVYGLEISTHLLPLARFHAIGKAVLWSLSLPEDSAAPCNRALAACVLYVDVLRVILVLRARSSCAWARSLLGRRDPAAYRAVLAEAAKPEKAKALGRGVRNFTEEAWGAAVLTVAREVAIARLGVEFMPGTFGVLLIRFLAFSCALFSSRSCCRSSVNYRPSERCSTPPVCAGAFPLSCTSHTTLLVRCCGARPLRRTSS